MTYARLVAVPTWIQTRRSTAYLNRGLQLKKDRLRDENLPCFCAEITDFRFQELDLLAWTASSDLQQSINDRVEVDFCLIRHGKREIRGDRRRGEGAGKESLSVEMGGGAERRT